LVEAAPVGLVLDTVDGAQRGGQLGPERGVGQAVEQAADLGSGQRAIGLRWWAWCQGSAGVGGAAAAAQATRNARASMAR
jgi:hypothetical protein